MMVPVGGPPPGPGSLFANGLPMAALFLVWFFFLLSQLDMILAGWTCQSTTYNVVGATKLSSCERLA